MNELIKRLEETKEGSRALDAEIARSLGWEIDQQDLRGIDKWLAPNSSYTTYLPKFTTSIDAALTLVPEGWRVHRMQEGDNGHWSCHVAEKEGRGGSSGESWATYPTPALALCIASLKARKGD